jgi:redox-sensitive bicupin YhaK (pirin superfamily)
MPASSPILQHQPLAFPWPTIDPFLFCAYHDDAYPAGNARLGPATSLAGRSIGSDFSRQDGWSMYHGATVPGFPPHPHRGFETVTVVRQGLVDHADSLGARARYGAGDVQWLTTGAGIVHAEMFPLLHPDQPNPLELFQIWLNLPARSKMAAPHFTMFWQHQVPRLRFADAAGLVTEVVVTAGRLGDVTPPAPPPDSWAAQPDADVAIWTITMAPGARWTLPAAVGANSPVQTQRQLYFFHGASVQLAGQTLDAHAAIRLDAAQAVELVNGAEASEFLLLQGRPLHEPVAQYGPFVMNTRAEIEQAMADYRRTQFGGWPWGDAEPVHGSDPARFTQMLDGPKVVPPVQSI